MNKSENLTILVVDDHPFTSDAYISMISKAKDKDNYTFIKATTCEIAFTHLEANSVKGKTINMALVDINLPPFEEKNIQSGIDLAAQIREKFPLCKIIMLTMHSEHLILNRVYKNINPEGFISKNDIDFTTFPALFFKIKNGENYYSPTITKSLQSLIHNTLNWDEFDTQIIFLLEKGVQTKNMPNHIDLALSTIEKRKANIKSQLANQKITDEELISICKMLNFI